MKANSNFFIGIDVSKPFFDASLMAVVNHKKQGIETARFDNTASGLKAFTKWLKTFKVTMDQSTLVVIENTGIYHRLIWSFCNEKGLSLHIGNAAHIKWSFGIARGKNDKIDSVRLCKYANKEADELRISPTLNAALMQLKDLFTSRTRLLSQVNSNKQYIKELKNINEPRTQKLLEQVHQTAIKGIAQSIKDIEALINKIIAENADFKNNYELLITVPGIGHLTAVYLICCTTNFSAKITGKQLACYAGVAPFENTSGISIKGRNRVHHMANKELKKLFHLSALSVIQYYPEFRMYYDRKKEEGKHPMAILNAIRNKIALRVAAVINHQKPYVNNNLVAA